MYTIGNVAEMTGFSPDTLRYYEKIGLLPKPERSKGGKRTYDDDSIGYPGIWRNCKNNAGGWMI